VLYSAGINAVVAFAKEGKVIWGQKTLLDSTSSFNRINVRRLFLVLEKSIATYARAYLFEPNDEFTQRLLKGSIDSYLTDVKARRGIYDFMVICDNTNNTPARIDRGELWCDIMIKPVRSAEFIILRFTNASTGMSFEELTNNSTFTGTNL
jgi:phage tail sheath protein FI